MAEIANALNVNISQRELRILEQRDLTEKDKILRRFTVFLPALFLLIHLLEHLYFPSYKSYSPSIVYVGILAALFVALIVWIVISFFSYKAFEKLRHASALYVAIAVLLTAYDIATIKLGALALPYFPWVGKVLDAMLSDRSKLWECVYHSFKLLFTGYFAGVGIGLVCGILAGWSPKVQYWIQPITRVLGAIPSTTYMPIVMMLASSLFGGAAFLIGLGVWFPVTVSAMNGVQNVQKHYYEAAQTLGTNRLGILTRVVVPASMPTIFTGLTQGMSIACLTLVVAEMMGVEAGLGWYINWQKGWGDFTKMYGAIILICITFILVNTILGLIRKRVLRWQDGGI
jgi:NitT/TauT family transport system permease protein